MTMIRADSEFKNKRNTKVYIIKGDWNKSAKGVCWLVRKDGKGRSYSENITVVKDVWHITEEEFRGMTDNRLESFEQIKME
jgi:hypothetical protein